MNDKNIAYKKQENSFVCITDKLIFIATDNKRGKIISDRKEYREAIDVLSKFEDITKEDFESHLKQSTGEEAFFKSVYQTKVNIK